MYLTYQTSADCAGPDTWFKCIPNRKHKHLNLTLILISEEAGGIGQGLRCMYSATLTAASTYSKQREEQGCVQGCNMGLFKHPDMSSCYETSHGHPECTPNTHTQSEIHCNGWYSPPQCFSRAPYQRDTHLLSPFLRTGSEPIPRSVWYQRDRERCDKTNPLGVPDPVRKARRDWKSAWVTEVTLAWMWYFFANQPKTLHTVLSHFKNVKTNRSVSLFKKFHTFKLHLKYIVKYSM